MRSSLSHLADVVNVRGTVSHIRDRFVDLLTGNGSAEQQRNRKDDRNFKLLLRFMLRPDSNYLDIGASRGKFLREIVRFAPAGHHIAYEPVPSLSQALTQAFPDIEVRRIALSNAEGRATFVHVLDEGHQGYSRFEQYTELVTYPEGLTIERFDVRTERLDGHLPEGWLPDFVKIDVEGAELPVLEGAVDTLRRARPVLVFEHGDSSDAGVSTEIHALLTRTVGLRVFDMDGNGPYDVEGFLAGLASKWNWLAHE